MIEELLERFAIWRARRAGRRWGPTMLLASGARFHPFDARPEDVNILDIARGLATECRYNGQVVEFYSVAEHSVHVSIFVERAVLLEGTRPRDVRRARRFAREALLHDASEAYLGDIIRPIKYIAQMQWYRRAEARLQAAIFERFGVESTLTSRRYVKAADDAMLTDETVARVGVDVEAYATKYGAALGADVRCLPPAQAERLFAARFAELFPEEVAAAGRLV